MSAGTDSTDRVTLLGYRVGWSLVRRMPAPVAYGLFARTADQVWRRGGTGVRRLRANYARVRPELDGAALDALTREGVRSYARYWCDAFRLPDRTPGELAASVRAVGDGPVREHLATGGGAVMFLGHLGNWDLAGAWSTTRLAPVTTVAERLRPAELYARFLSFREELGMTILGTDGPEVFGQLTTALGDGAFVPLLADRDLSRRGIEARLCGHRVRMAVGPAALALRTGAPLHPVSVHYELLADRPAGTGADDRAAGGPEYRRSGRGRGMSEYGIVVTFGERVAPPEHGTTREKVRAMTQQCADMLGRAIVEHTEDWHMMQRVFTADLDQRDGAMPADTVHPGEAADTADTADTAHP